MRQGIIYLISVTPGVEWSSIIPQNLEWSRKVAAAYVVFGVKAVPYFVFVAAYNEKDFSHRYVVTNGINRSIAFSERRGNSSRRLAQKFVSAKDLKLSFSNDEFWMSIKPSASRTSKLRLMLERDFLSTFRQRMVVEHWGSIVRGFYSSYPCAQRCQFWCPGQAPSRCSAETRAEFRKCRYCRFQREKTIG